MAKAAASTKPTRRFLTAPAAAEYISVAPRSMASRRWREAQGIPSFKLGSRCLRFDVDELDRWIASRKKA